MNGFDFVNIVEHGDRAVAGEPGERTFAVVKENTFGDVPGSGNSGLVFAAVQYKTFHGIPFGSVRPTKTKKPADEQRAFLQGLETWT